MSKVARCLWFDGKAEEAARFYVSLLPDSSIDSLMRLPVDTPSTSAGTVTAVEFTLCGEDYIALNGGPNFSFTPAFSMFVKCDDQAEVDRLWDALLEGGEPMACGWLTDRYGLAWQIVPRQLGAMITDPDRARASRATKAMMDMVKLDIAELEAAYKG